MLAWLASLAAAATLPGLSLPFDVGEDGRWQLGSNLPTSVAEAGAAPGWVLTAVDDRTDLAEMQRWVGTGPARDLRLRFEVPAAKKGAKPTEAVLQVRRSPLATAEQVASLPWPEGFTRPTGAWHGKPGGSPAVEADNGTVWTVDLSSMALQPGQTTGSRLTTPELFWELTSVAWTRVQPTDVAWGDLTWARQTFRDALRVDHWGGSPGEHLLLPTPSGLEVYALEFPRGTPALPTCDRSVPETCLAAGKSLLDTLGDRRGAAGEAARLFEQACADGVYRACFEAVALQDPNLASGVQRCVEGGEPTACNAVGKSWYELDPDHPTPLTLGLLEHACDAEGSGTLGERLRRLEDVGQGCQRLADAYDALQQPDQALLALDRGCVLGRAAACEQASGRRQDAYAARTVRECENEEAPIAPACVDMGRILQERPLPYASFDDFGSFLRACTLGATEGCILLGDYVDRWGIDHPRVLQAERQLAKACQDGEQRACLGSAHLLVRHEPRTEAYGQALVLFDQVCRQGLADGCVAAAEQRRIGSARQVTAPTQLEHWSSACSALSPEGCLGLGERQSKVKDAWPDAFSAWTQACELGESHACTELGLLVARKHEPTWPAEQPGPTYLRRGCDAGDPEGCFRLAEQDLERNVDPPEPTYLLLEQSCQGEFGPGCAALAEVHLTRETNFDDEIAAKHLDVACANGHYESCRVLGLMYVQGKGVDRDRERARELLERFRSNAERHHIRIGLTGGLPAPVGVEAELVLPIPVGPAISVSGHYSYVPGAASILMLIEGDEAPPNGKPDLRVLGGVARLYPNTQARGFYGGLSYQTLEGIGETPQGDRFRTGWSARIGIRNEVKGLMTGIETGMGSFGVLRLRDFDEDEKGAFPVILPVFALSIGGAFL